MAFFLLDKERDLQFVTALNTEYRLLIGYIFWRSEYPWLMVWEENRRQDEPPWNGETMTRGMEFGNTRIPGSAKEYFKKPEMYGEPTFGWLDGSAKVTKRYMAFMSEIPQGTSGVLDVRLENGEIVVDTEGVKHTLRIAYSPDLFPRP